VDLTLAMMRKFGAPVKREGYRRFWIEQPVGYVPPGEGGYFVEPDASSASYFLAAGAITGDPVEVFGINDHSLQGEAKFATTLKKMGTEVEYGSIDRWTKVQRETSQSLHAIDIDMDLLSDTGMTLAVVALFAKGKTTIRNVGNWRLKETDRLKAMATELRKLGATVELDKTPEWPVLGTPVSTAVYHSVVWPVDLIVTR
jgi:3-phosphoshikimate 1-carboxyvinyltransferase